MTKKRPLFLRFQKQCETSDEHFDPDLKSHYYKASLDKVFNVLKEIFEKNPNMKVTSISKEHGEIAVEMKPFNAFMIVTIIQVRPFETAVDFTISSEKFSLLGMYPKLKQIILQNYQTLDKSLPFIGKK